MRALITGAAGQDGILLSQDLLASGAEVVGLVKPGTDTSFLLRYTPGVQVIECDLSDSALLREALADTSADEIYNLGGISSIVESFNDPVGTHAVNVGAVRTILEALAENPGHGRLVQASSGTIFEKTDIAPQNEATPRSPHSPYAKAKAESMDLIAQYRADHGVHASAAILYNHESPLRGSGFVTRRITEGVARIAAGQQQGIELGNLDVSRDWGWAPDYVRGMQLMMRSADPRDYILATGQTHQLSEFLQLAFAAIGIDNWSEHVTVREDLKRAVDPVVLKGDSTAAYRDLGWQHTKSFAEMVQAMVDFDRELLANPEALWHEA
jgi:GDPmannose 4,6-dehydratase